MCDNIRCHIRISPDCDQFCGHVTSFNVHIVTTGPMNTLWWKLDSHTSLHKVHTELFSIFIEWYQIIGRITYPSPVCSVSWSPVGCSSCLRCWLLSGMIGIGSEVEGEGGLTPSRYTMAGSPLDKRSGHNFVTRKVWPLVRARLGPVLRPGGLCRGRQPPSSSASHPRNHLAQCLGWPEAGWGGEDGSSFGGWVLGQCTECTVYCVMYSTARGRGGDSLWWDHLEQWNMANISQLILTSCMVCKL